MNRPPVLFASRIFMACMAAEKARHEAGQAGADWRKAKRLARKAMERAMAHKCSNGASDTTDNDLQRSDPAR